MSTMDYHKNAFNSVGWFIPPYITLGFLGKLAKRINDNSAFNQQELEDILSSIYSPEYLAAMVSERYPITPYISDYKGIISEAIVAHFMKLDHVAVAGLIPVIEGTGRKLVNSRSVDAKPRCKNSDLFMLLANDCKNDAIKNNMGAVGEIISMMDSFIEYTKNYLYADSNNYILADKTNRNGIVHGRYADKDYGKPINFYKSIAAIDFLCFVSAFRASISWFAPSSTESSKLLSDYYCVCIALGDKRP